MKKNCTSVVRDLLIAVIISFAFVTGLRAQEIVVFAKGDSLALGPATSSSTITNPVKAAFLNTFKADLALTSASWETNKLTDFPVYGRNVAGAGGEFRYHASFKGGFVAVTTLGGLLPGHKYILTLNGQPSRAGNTNLVDLVSSNSKEKYYDFQTITTDAGGKYHATFGVALPAGPYDVRFYVKDTADFKIVLYHDFFKFAVE
jgi:hypothetical protein